MLWQPRITVIDGRRRIFCDWRRRFVCLTPEEWVRQHFLHRLVEDFHYPASAIAVEYTITVGEVRRRCDAVVFDRFLSPRCIIEFKAPDVSLSQRVFDQVAVYNRRLSVPFFILSNGSSLAACRVTDDGLHFLPSVPERTILFET